MSDGALVSVLKSGYWLANVRNAVTWGPSHETLVLLPAHRPRLVGHCGPGQIGQSAEEAPAGARGGERLPARIRFPRYGYDRTPRAGNGFVGFGPSYRHRSPDQEETRIQRKKSR